MRSGWALDDAEIAFLRFSVTEPLPVCWQFAPPPQGGNGEAVFQAVKILENGEVVAAEVTMSSFTRLGIYFDEDYTVNTAGRLLLDRVRVR